MYNYRVSHSTELSALNLYKRRVSPASRACNSFSEAHSTTLGTISIRPGFHVDKSLHIIAKNQSKKLTGSARREPNNSREASHDCRELLTAPSDTSPSNPDTLFQFNARQEEVFGWNCNHHKQPANVTYLRCARRQ